MRRFEGSDVEVSCVKVVPGKWQRDGNQGMSSGKLAKFKCETRDASLENAEEDLEHLLNLLELGRR